MVVHEHVTSTGNIQKLNIHKDCYPKYLKEKEFKEKEAKELDHLVEVIIEIHGGIHQRFYPFLQDLRNGTVLLGRNKRKKYKEGYPYPLIADTYLYCRESIEYWKKNKEFDSLLSELKYGFMIVNDKITVVKKKNEKKEFLKAKREAEQKNDTENNLINNQNEDVAIFKKQKRQDDISDFL